MKIRELTLQNFRSYGETPTKIEFDDSGVVLFEGDIGSGKSSILYAIEFALFGLGELDAKSILRSAANNGKVEIVFEIGGKEYRVTRMIERKRGAKTTTLQTRGWIEEAGVNAELSPTELRSRILQILNFKEKQSAKASSRIYRYAIFTPQELMKEVLIQRPDDRLDTLRRAFGIEDYSFAFANAGIVLSHLDSQIKVYSSLSQVLPAKETELISKETELGEIMENLASVERRLGLVEGKLVETRSLFDELEVEVEKLRQTQALIPVLERNLDQVRAQFEEQKTDLQNGLRMREEITREERRLDSLRNDYERYLSLREKLRELEKIVEETRRLEIEITKLNQEIASKEANLSTELRLKDQQALKLEEKIGSYKKEISGLGALENKTLDLRTNIEAYFDAQNAVEELKSEVGSASALLTEERSKIENTKRKIESLDGISMKSKCPLCGQVLNEEHLQAVRRGYRVEIEASMETETMLNANLSKLRLRLNSLEKERDNGRGMQRELEILDKEKARLEQLVSILSNLEADKEDLETHAKSIKERISSRKFANGVEDSLRKMTEAKDSLSTPLKEYPLLRSEYQKLEDSGILEAYQRAQSIVTKKAVVFDQIKHLETRTKELEIDIGRRAKEIDEKRKELEQSEPIILQHAKIRDEVDSLEEECGNLRTQAKVSSEKVKQQRAALDALSKEVGELRKYSLTALKSSDVRSFLSEGFVPAIGDIERYVLASINEEFAHQFQRIFSILTYEEGNLSVTIDDSFTPVIEQGGYELEVQSLSGGERTAVALAYRLVLNYMVKRANEAMQSSLLILDEPTEGFSKEQIYRFRNTLEELGDDQVIIVSHERDLEPMADRVFRVEKQNGVSVVTSLSSS